MLPLLCTIPTPPFAETNPFVILWSSGNFLWKWHIIISSSLSFITAKWSAGVCGRGDGAGRYSWVCFTKRDQSMLFFLKHRIFKMPCCEEFQITSKCKWCKWWDGCMTDGGDAGGGWWWLVGRLYDGLGSNIISIGWQGQYRLGVALAA